jgi:hypothetical protein
MKLRNWLIAALFLLALGCATSGEYVNPPAYSGSGPSWWGMDAVCSPGCPAGPSSRW